MNVTRMCTGSGTKQIDSPTPNAPVMLRRCSDHSRRSTNTWANGREHCASPSRKVVCACCASNSRAPPPGSSVVRSGASSIWQRRWSSRRDADHWRPSRPSSCEGSDRGGYYSTVAMPLPIDASASRAPGRTRLGASMPSPSSVRSRSTCLRAYRHAGFGTSTCRPICFGAMIHANNRRLADAMQGPPRP